MRTEDWAGGTLRSQLAEALSTARGQPVRVASIRRLVYLRSSHSTARLLVTLDDGEAITVVAKRLRRDRKSSDGGREILAYRDLLYQGRFGAPLLYASVHDVSGERFLLFLEDVGEDCLKHAGIGEWLAAVRWLATLHAAYRGRVDELRSYGWLPEQGSAYSRQLVSDARRNLVQVGACTSIERFDRLVRHLPTLVERLVQDDPVLVHGDLHPDNVLLQPASRIRVVDWESTAIGAGALDLVSLIDGWDGVERVELIDAYWRALEKESRTPVDRAACACVLGLCDAVQAIRYLAWDVSFCSDPVTVTELLDSIETGATEYGGGLIHG